jgi:Transposase DDE domain
LPHWEAYLLSNGSPPRGPKPGLCVSEIITILLMLHGSGAKYLKSFYNGVVGEILRRYFPKMPCYERFVTLQPNVLLPLLGFLLSRRGQPTGIYYIDSTALAVCHNRRIGRHKTFAGLAARGKTSMGWFFGFKLHLVFNHLHEIVALKLTPGNVHDGMPVEQLTQNLTGKLFGDKGYLGKQRAAALLKRGLVLMTKVRKNMKALPLTLIDKLLLNARNMAETIIGHIKAFSSLNFPIAVFKLLYGIATVSEPAARIRGRDGGQRMRNRRVQRVVSPGLGLAQIGFELGPARLDRCHIG